MIAVTAEYAANLISSLTGIAVIQQYALESVRESSIGKLYERKQFLRLGQQRLLRKERDLVSKSTVLITPLSLKLFKKKLRKQT